MNNETLNQILMLNKKFYQNISPEFSSTRQNMGRGWDRVGEYLKRYEGRKIKVLDLGCGNGRFYDFLKEKTKLEVKYLGLDQNRGLIEEGKTKHGECFRIQDILNLETIHEKFDVIVGFGITHHLPSYELRRRWFRSLATLLEDEGTIVLSYWDFNPTKAVHPLEIDETQLDVNDFFLTWDNRGDVFRYCHKYEAAELNAIKEMYFHEGIVVTDEFSDDGKDGKSNKYIIYTSE